MTYTPNYAILPEHMQESMRRYIEEGARPGSFLSAVLENNLVRAFSRADEINSIYMINFARFLYNEAPLDAWGSEQAVRDWIQSKWEERVAANPAYTRAPND